MRPIVCELKTQSVPPHLQQIFTGFGLLARAGAVELSECFVRGDRTRDWTLTAVVDGRTVVYDVHDSHVIERQLLESADAYFKRGYRADYVASLGDLAPRVRPLGLNYEVYPDGVDLARARRNWRLRKGFSRFSGVLSALQFSPRFAPRQRSLEAASCGPGIGRVLFLTRAYDPHDVAQRSATDVRQREAIAETRARCIVQLRRHFGTRVLAGFAPSDYAARRYPSLVVPDPRIVEKSRYLRLVRESDVCITSTGIHGSIGWKFGEYIALGKAVVTEPLQHSVPGPLAPGLNYLSFATEEECVEMADELLSNSARRVVMCRNNLAYYEQYLRPDRLVLNTLNDALGRSAPSVSWPVARFSALAQT